jgi:protein associated with RNAse G/E
MAASAGKILKSQDVKVEGQFQLNFNNVGINTSDNRNSISREPQVRISESQPGFAVVEVICSCGSKIYIKCEYENTQAEEG